MWGWDWISPAQLARRGHYSICVLTSCCSFPEPLLDKRERWKESAWPNTKAGEWPVKNWSDKKKTYFNPIKNDFLKRNLMMRKAEKSKTQIVDMIWMFFSRTTKRKFGFLNMSMKTRFAYVKETLSGTWGKIRICVPGWVPSPAAGHVPGYAKCSVKRGTIRGPGGDVFGSQRYHQCPEEWETNGIQLCVSGE